VRVFNFRWNRDDPSVRNNCYRKQVGSPPNSVAVTGVNYEVINSVYIYARECQHPRTVDIKYRYHVSGDVYGLALELPRHDEPAIFQVLIDVGIEGFLHTTSAYLEYVDASAAGRYREESRVRFSSPRPSRGLERRESEARSPEQERGF